MKRRETYLLLTAGLPLAISSCVGGVQEAKKPNILYIFPDQYRMQALSIWSDPEYRELLSTVADPVVTPNIDKLAREGVIFTQATSTHPVSSPHRAMLLSGMYPHNNGVYDINCKVGREQELKHDIVCLTDVLAESGYETAYVGKTHWHKTEPLFDKKGTYIGSTEAPGGELVGRFDTYIPEGGSRHSNKFWFQQLNDSHFNAITYSNRPELVGGKSDGEQYRPHRFTSAVEADVIIDYLENKNNQRDCDKPFSIIWSINPPHPPHSKLAHCSQEIYETYFKDMPIEELLNRENVSDKARAAFELKARIYFSLIKAVDDEIGRVLETLEKIGEEKNTIVVFTADHGEMMGSHHKSGKNWIYDESFLVPFIIKYPDAIRPHTSTDLLIGSIDIMPTLLSMAGLKDQIPATVEGRDYSQGIITGSFDEVAKPTSALYMRSDLRGVRNNKYTYVVTNKGKHTVYDNIADPYQNNELTLDSIPASDAAQLKRELGFWLADENRDNWYGNDVIEELVTYPEI